MSERYEPNPHNLDQFSDLKAELLGDVATDIEKQQIEQTFAPSNTDDLSILTSP